jgi:hypothetical protein
MTEAVFRWRYCERKKKHTSRKCAERAIRMKRKKGIIVDGLNIYKCKYLNYHIGHKK